MSPMKRCCPVVFNPFRTKMTCERTKTKIVCGNVHESESQA